MAAETATGQTQVAHADKIEADFPPFDPSTYGSQLIWLAITFGVLYLLVSRVIAPRIGGILEVRQDRIEGDKAEALRLRDETDQAIASYEQALAEARSNAHGIAQAARDEAKAAADAERAGLDAHLAGRLAEAEQRVDQLKTEAMAEVDDIATDITAMLVTLLSGKSANEADISAAIKAAS